MNSLYRYQRAVAFLEGLSNIDRAHRPTDAGRRPIQRIGYFLNLLGHPERKLRYVHITGTSGKSTVTATVAEMLAATGAATGRFISPFCQTTAEKIWVNGRYIAPAVFADLVDGIKPALDQAARHSPWGVPNYFETLFALGLLHFAHERCRWAVIEVGAGGTHDATNSIPAPHIAAITNVDLDHTAILGPTLAHIAREKAGIIKRGTTLLTTERRPALLRIFQSRCRTVRAHYRPLSTERSADANTVLARAIGSHLGVGSASMKRINSLTPLPCRFEMVQKNPIVILDGAHNPSKTNFLARRLSTIAYRRLHLVIGTAANKDMAGTLKPVVGLAHSIICTRSETLHRKAADPARLAQLAAGNTRAGATVTVRLDPNQALDEAIARARATDAVLVTGSFFLAGALRERWYPTERVLRERRSFF